MSQRLIRCLSGGLLLWLILMVLASCSSQPVTTSWVETFDEVGTWRLSTDATADVAMIDGQLRITVWLPGVVAWAAAGQSVDDALIRVEATPISGPVDNEFGLLLRMDDDAQFYAFSISADGYVRIARYGEGTWTVLGPDWMLHPAVKQGMETNLLEVEAHGTQFVFRVNGEDVAKMEDDGLSRGDVGLYAGAFSDGDVVIAFDNLMVQPLSEVK